MPYCTQHREADRDWPRDFDIRASHAEQQELLAEGETASAPVQDNPNDE